MMTAMKIFRLFVAALLVPVLIGAGGKHPSADISAEINQSAVHPGDKIMLAVVVTVHDGLHAQSHTPVSDDYIPFEVKPGAGGTFGTPVYPAGTDKNYPDLGKLNVYEGDVVVRIPVTIPAGAKEGALKITGTVKYQACNDNQCFQPEKPDFSVETTVVPVGTAVAKTHADLFPDDATTKPAAPAGKQAAAVPVVAPDANPPAAGPTESAAIPAAAPVSILGFDLTHSPWPIVFGLAFVVGIIFNAMPCVLPVVPLKIMGFYEVSQHDRKKCLALGGVFSLGLIASFAVLATLIVGVKFLHWGDLFQHTWFTVTIVVILLAMAVNTFGWFDIPLPSGMYSFSPRHDTYTGNFLFGILTAALSTPCTFGMFVALLTWSITVKTWMGVSAITMVGVGMAFPYFVLSAFPELARKFPRTGPWSNVVKQLMGFFLLATAVFFAAPLVGKFMTLASIYWALFAVFAGAALFLLVRTFQLSPHARARIIGTAIAAVIVVPAFVAVRWLNNEPYKWTAYSDQARDRATASGKPVLIDFTATWCSTCHVLEASTLHDPKVLAAVRNHDVVMLKADVTDGGAAGQPLLRRLRSDEAIPLTAVYYPDHKDPVVLTGIYSAEDLVRTLDRN